MPVTKMSCLLILVFLVRARQSTEDAARNLFLDAEIGQPHGTNIEGCMHDDQKPKPLLVQEIDHAEQKAKDGRVQRAEETLPKIVQSPEEEPDAQDHEAARKPTRPKRRLQTVEQKAAKHDLLRKARENDHLDGPDKRRLKIPFNRR